MKTLVLMRHAKAEKDFINKPDMDRLLSDRGEEDAKEMGKRLHKSGFKPDLIVCSPSKRTYKTAKIVADEIHYKQGDIKTEELLYEAGIDNLLKVIRHTDDKRNSLLMVGHNPLFTSVPGYLTNTFVEHLPTAGYVLMHFKADSWKLVAQHSGELIKIDFPKNDEE